MAWIYPQATVCLGRATPCVADCSGPRITPCGGYSPGLAAAVTACDFARRANTASRWAM